MSEERYEIRGKLGQGGLGAVYRAYDRNLNREVAIKRVLPDGEAESQEEATSSLLKEAKALSAIQHPHIVTVYDCGVDEDGPYVVMEILEGRTIEEMVGQGTLVWEDFREVVMQTQEALIAAQDLDLVHRDLKPGNIMVIWLPSGKFQIKLVDFGLAKFSPTPSLQTMDHGHAVFGSIYFMAPEQFERRPLDQRTDMYAMGAIYYYTLTGDYPFDGDTAPQVMAAHLQHKVENLGEIRQDIPDWACEWVMWHIERDMDNRPANARESLQRFLALEKQANGQGGDGATGPQNLGGGTGQITSRQPVTSSVKLRTGPVNVPSGTSKLQSTSTVAGGEGAQPPSSVGLPSGYPELPKKSLLANKPLVLAISAALVVFIVIAAVIFFDQSGKNKDKQALLDVIAAGQKAAEQKETIKVSDAEIENLLEYYISTESEYAQAAWPLGVAEGDQVDRRIAEFILSRRVARDRRLMLLDILKQRGSSVSAEVFASNAVTTDNESLAAETLGAVRSLVTFDHLEDLLKILQKTDNTRLLLVVEDAITDLLKKDPSMAPQFAEQFATGLETTEAENKQVIFMRLMATTGTRDARTVIQNELTAPSDARKRRALEALGNWPDDSVIELLIEFLDRAELSPELKGKAFESAVAILATERERDQAMYKDSWSQLARKAPTVPSKRLLISKIRRIPGEWVDNILIFLQGDPDDDVSYDAEKAMDNR